MTFNGSAMKTLLDGARAKGAFDGIAALMAGRDSTLFHHTAGEANERRLGRNASMITAVATTDTLQVLEQARLGPYAAVESILPEFGRLQHLGALDSDNNDKPRLQQYVCAQTRHDLSLAAMLL